MKYDIITLFPEFVQSYFQSSIAKRAIENNIIEIQDEYIDEESQTNLNNVYN